MRLGVRGGRGQKSLEVAGPGGGGRPSYECRLAGSCPHRALLRDRRMLTSGRPGAPSPSITPYPRAADGVSRRAQGALAATDWPVARGRGACRRRGWGAARVPPSRASSARSPDPEMGFEGRPRASPGPCLKVGSHVRAGAPAHARGGSATGQLRKKMRAAASGKYGGLSSSLWLFLTVDVVSTSNSSQPSGFGEEQTFSLKKRRWGAVTRFRGAPPHRSARPSPAARG